MVCRREKKHEEFWEDNVNLKIRNGELHVGTKLADVLQLSSYFQNHYQLFLFCFASYLNAIEPNFSMKSSNEHEGKTLLKKNKALQARITLLEACRHQSKRKKKWQQTQIISFWLLYSRLLRLTASKITFASKFKDNFQNGGRT